MLKVFRLPAYQDYSSYAEGGAHYTIFCFLYGKVLLLSIQLIYRVTLNYFPLNPAL